MASGHTEEEKDHRSEECDAAEINGSAVTSTALKTYFVTSITTPVVVVVSLLMRHVVQSCKVFTASIFLTPSTDEWTINFQCFDQHD
jgi:putative exporter of polyketide antibiotics